MAWPVPFPHRRSRVSARDDGKGRGIVLRSTSDTEPRAAAIDARHHTYPRRHDMAAEAIRTLMQYPPKQLMTIRGTLTVIRVKQTNNDNSL